MVQLICIMIQLANVSQTVGGQLATAEALVLGEMKVWARVYGE